jgi:uncharacterized protein DUF4153
MDTSIESMVGLPRAQVGPRTHGALAPTDARAVAVVALLLGVAGDALLRDGPPGAAFPLWIAALVLNLRALVNRSGRPLTREAGLWLAAAVVFALGIAWRDSEALIGLDLLATASALGMAAVVLGRPEAGLLAPRLQDTLVVAVRVVASVAGGAISLVLRELHLEHARDRISARGTPILRSIAIAAVLLLVFGSLLRGADPIFASFVALPNIDPGIVMSHIVLTGFLAWITAGWARASLVPTTETADETVPFQFAPRDAMTALGTLDVLFAAFVLAQLGWLFGGDAYLRARTGLTAAEYARRGFFEMVWVVALAVPILVATRSRLTDEIGARRRHTAFALPLVALLGAIILSAAFRLKLYVDYYGLTTDRLYAVALMAWLAIVIVWLVATVLRDHGRAFVAGAVLSGLAMLGVLNLSDPDRIVARVNVARAASVARTGSGAPALDLRHLAGLRGGAVPIAVREVLRPSTVQLDSVAQSTDVAARCDAASELLRRWGPSSRLARQDVAGAWRWWNADNVGALRVVSERAAELERVASTGCRRHTN